MRLFSTRLALVAALVCGLATAFSGTVQAATSTTTTSLSAGSLTASQVAAVTAYKASHDTEAAQIAALGAQYAAQNAAKTQAFQSGTVPKLGAQRAPLSGGISPDMLCCGNPNPPSEAVVPYLVQYGQDTGWFCGPATVSEMSATVPGPSAYNLNQYTVASYMGTTTSGTGEGQEVSGLNYYVGQPDMGYAYYSFVDMNYTPTSSQDNTFVKNLEWDVTLGTPIAGDAWEVGGSYPGEYPHLVGHPYWETIFHFFEIGGYNLNNGDLYYADSATTVWSTVPAYSWFPISTVETILGGRGYIW